MEAQKVPRLVDISTSHHWLELQGCSNMLIVWLYNKACLKCFYSIIHKLYVKGVHSSVEIRHTRKCTDTKIFFSPLIQISTNPVRIGLCTINNIREVIE